MFSAVNFRAILDHFQGVVMVFSRPDEAPTGISPFLYQFPNSDRSPSKEWRQELQAYEDAKKAERHRRGIRAEWTKADSTEARSERARQLIVLTNHPEILVLLNSDDGVKLMSEKYSFLRVWGNTEAHKFVDQALVLEEMVEHCADRLELFEASGLSTMIKLIRPSTA